mmetsp:Transcript_12557/g.33231  ORF Transcript_12557/g.33231 Transcript_12557/m.33231 type:complete len:82 (-) Transcript_12557:497-742(-)
MLATDGTGKWAINCRHSYSMGQCIRPAGANIRSSGTSSSDSGANSSRATGRAAATRPRQKGMLSTNTSISRRALQLTSSSR